MLAGDLPTWLWSRPDGPGTREGGVNAVLKPWSVGQGRRGVVNQAGSMRGGSEEDISHVGHVGSGLAATLSGRPSNLGLQPLRWGDRA